MPASILFWDVDTQADFMYPEGKLYVPGAETIIPNLRQLTAWAAEHRVPIVSSACAHHPGDTEFLQYPPHCLSGTAGQQKIPETRLPNALIVPNRRVDLPRELSAYQQIILEKQQLDVLSNPNTEALLARLGPAHEVVLYGVVTEICVAYAARALMRHGYPLTVVTDAIRHLEESKSQAVLKNIEHSGGTLITTADLLSDLSLRLAA